MHKKIDSITDLKAESPKGSDFFILLRGNLRSSKWILWDASDRVFHVYNESDDTEQVLTESQIMDRDFTNIGYAMVNGALFKYGFGTNAAAMDPGNGASAGKTAK